MKKTVIYILSIVFLGLGGCGQDPAGEARRHAAAAHANFIAAASLYEKQLAKEPGSGQLRYAAGMLYYQHGDLERAIGHLRVSKHRDAPKILAIALYRSGDYTAALEVFNRQEQDDDEYKYYRGLTCEKLNLFDEALKAYGSVNGRAFSRSARERVLIIEKAINPLRIQDIDPAAAAILARSPSKEEYPQAGALVLLSDERVEITPDNKAVYSMHYIVRILNERGKETFSEAPIEYDSTDEKVQLDYARTIRPDGTVVDVGSRHIRDVSKYLNFPLYSNARVCIISFPAVTEGATIEYKVTLYKSQLINKKDFVIPMLLQTQEPIIDSRFVLSTPDDRVLNVKLINERYNTFGAGLSPSVSRSGGRQTYEWGFRNIPQIIPEPDMPPVQEINPGMIMSSFNSWDELYKWWWGLARDKIKADDAIKQKVSELTGSIKSDEARLKAIHNFCAQKIRYVAVEYGQAGYEPHNAADIFRNKYGDCKDQAILLVTMLKEAGFDAWPVLIPTRDSFDMNPEFPAMLFNHCIACVLWKGQTVFMDPTAETCSFGDLPAGDQDRNVLVVRDKDYMVARTPLYPAAHNNIKQKLSLALAQDESVTGKREISSFGVYDQAQRYWLLYTVPDVVKDKISSKIQEISIGSSLDGYEVENLNDLNRPVLLRYEFRGPELMTDAGPLRILPGQSGLDMSAAAKATRVYPILYPVLDLKEIETAIALPADYAILYMPDQIRQENKWMKFSAGYSVNKNVLKFSQTAELRQRMVTQEEYPEYKKFLEQLAKSVKQRVVLERKKNVR